VLEIPRRIVTKGGSQIGLWFYMDVNNKKTKNAIINNIASLDLVYFELKSLRLLVATFINAHLCGTFLNAQA